MTKHSRRHYYGGTPEDDEADAKKIPTGEVVKTNAEGVRPTSQIGPLRPDGSFGGRHRHSRRHHHRRHKTLRPVPKGTHVKAKTLRRLLKSKGLKVSGKKSTLRARARKAHLIRGGEIY